MITTVTEKETRLSNMLTACTEAMKQVTAERDKLAAELKALRDSDVALPEQLEMVWAFWRGEREYLPTWGDYFSNDQLRDYGDRRAMAERERIIGQLLKLGVLGDGTYIEAIRKGE